MSIDIAGVTAIDTHVHIEADADGCFALDDELLDASAKYFKAGADRTPTLDSVADHYRSRNMAAVVFTVDAHTATGHKALSSLEIVGQAARHSDVLIPFASVDPHAADLGIPIVFHTGQTGIGAGLPGGRGIKLRYSDPMLLDDVAADHPDLTVIMAHPSVPWQDAAISIATHKANAYIDLSGWSPKYFPPQLVRAANGLLKRKVMFGSDYPLITPDRWLADFAALDIKEEVRPLILKDNAIRVLGLGPA
jgi:predicted TIM-barrel fold metal-dependent hydrolase